MQFFGLLLFLRKYGKLSRQPVRWLSSRKVLGLLLEEYCESRTRPMRGQSTSQRSVSDILTMSEDTVSLLKVQVLVLFQLVASV